MADEQQTQSDKTIFPRFSEDMTKKEMTDHIIEHHGVSYIHTYGSSQQVSATMKMTKGELIKWHDQQHEVIEHPDSVFDRTRGRWNDNTGRTEGEWVLRGNAQRPGLTVRPLKVDHTHQDIISEVTDEQLAAASRARNNERVSDKPLSPAERKVLKELVDNDFNALKSETQQFAADTFEAKRAEVELDWQDAKDKIPALVDEMVELKRKQAEELAALQAKHETQRQRIRDKAGKAGIVLQDRHGYDVQGEVQGLKDALSKARAEHDAMLQRALMTLERQRLTAQRQVLISGVTKESAEILDTIPDAKTLMVEAQRQQSELTAGR